jgi:capsular exopolysaccharide synthesis family protein
MSHIFDALQRSESERLGTKTSSIDAATELLERAERRALLQKESETVAGDFSSFDFAEPVPEPMPETIHAEDLARKLHISVDEEQSTDRATIFDQFQAIDASPSAESRLVSLTDRECPAAEAFRLLEVRLRNIRKTRPLQKVLITSTTPGEGKSFATANLACTLASGSKEKILLLGGDLRRPALPKLFGSAVNFGICEYLRGERSLPSSIYRLEKPGVWLLPSGSPQGDPLEMLQSTKFPPMIERLAAWFDWIIIDSPPVLPLADTTVLARLADGILLVARRGTSEKRKLKKGLEAFERSKLIGVLLNSSSSADDKEYYYYREDAALPGRRNITRG